MVKRKAQKIGTPFKTLKAIIGRLKIVRKTIHAVSPFVVLRRAVKKTSGFRSNPWTRRVIVLVLVTSTLVSSYGVFTRYKMEWSVPLTMCSGTLLILFLSIDSIAYIFDLLYSSPREALPLVRLIDPLINRAINDAEIYVKTLSGTEQRNEIEHQAKDIRSDFESRPPYPRVTVDLFLRAIGNFVLTIFCFAVITMTLARWDSYCSASEPTYTHDCSQVKGFKEAILHSFYYNSVIFQSLGDGSHAPKTFNSQFIATAETFVAFLYLILIFGGIYNAGAIVRDNLTPHSFESSLVDYFSALTPEESRTTRESIMTRSRDQL